MENLALVIFGRGENIMKSFNIITGLKEDR